MLDELGEHCRVGDVVSTFDAGVAALFAAPSGGAFAGGAVAFHFTAAVAAWLVRRHCDTTPRRAYHITAATPRISRRGLDICFRSIYFPETYRSIRENPRFRTHFLTLNPLYGIESCSAMLFVKVVPVR